MKSWAKLIVLASLSLFVVAGCGDSRGPGVTSDMNRIANPLQNSSIGDYVWNDANMNGIQDEDEMGMEGVAVVLYNCEGEVIADAVTDADGLYMFSELEAGMYYLGFGLPDGYVFSPMDQGDDDAMDSDADPETGMTECFELGEETADDSRDAGMYAAPEEGCTRGLGYWKNHAGFGPQPDMVTDLLPLRLGTEDGEQSMEITDASMAVDVLRMRTYGFPSNGITKLYAHLLTAKLNIANGADDEDIAEVIAASDEFLAANSWESWDELSHEDRAMVLGWKDMLESYNSGEIGPGSCGDEMMY